MPSMTGMQYEEKELKIYPKTQDGDEDGDGVNPRLAYHPDVDFSNVSQSHFTTPFVVLSGFVPIRANISNIGSS
jgi:hypothetical protein